MAPLKESSLLIGIIVYLSILSTKAQLRDEGPAYKKLHKELLKGYDSSLRPIKDRTKPINIKIVLFVESIVEVDVRKQHLQFSCWLILHWRDEYLTWDPAKYEKISTLDFTDEITWSPDIIPINLAPVSHSPIHGRVHHFTVNSSGNALMVVRGTMTVECIFDLTNYPMDKHSCDIILASHSYNSKELVISEGFFGKISHSSNKHPEWDLTNVTGKVRFETIGNIKISSADVSITMTRRTDIHLYYILIPYLSASFLGILMFFLPVGSYKRFIFTLISLFILLNLLITLSYEVGFHSTGVPFVIRCISVNMLVLAIVFISSNLMYHIVMKSMVLCPPLPNSLVNYLANPFISKLLCIGQVDDQTSPSFADEEAGEGNENTFDHGNVPKTVVKEWLLIIQYIDRVLLLVYVITLIIYHT